MDSNMVNQRGKKPKQEEKPRATLWPFRNLSNYKQMHAERARSKGVYEKFVSAPTLTAARRILG